MKPTIAELEAILEEKDVEVEILPNGEVHVIDRRMELIQRAEAAEARAEAAEKKARDLALVIETAPTYAEPRIAAQVVNQLTERAEQAEAREGRLLDEFRMVCVELHIHKHYAATGVRWENCEGCASVRALLPEYAVARPAESNNNKENL